MTRSRRLVATAVTILALLLAPVSLAGDTAPNPTIGSWIQQLLEEIIPDWWVGKPDRPTDKHGTFIEPGGTPADPPEDPDDPDAEHGIFIEPGG